ncbi:glutamate--tRNA ligase [Candidatus Campbellbacteria bacterium]|nr:MAG: glutamate--tRNA ligase [Candidatus Campbellbacteria bacterium]
MKNNSSQNVVVRFAPSPTGFLHIGGVRGALFNFLFARKHGGTYALRIEDTDKERSREEWTTGLIEDLAWLGLHHDVFAKQSERTELYKTSLQKLIDSGHAYISKETPTEPGQRDEVIRFKNPKSIVTFEDMIRGTVSVDTTDLGDFVIARSIDEPVYHFAVVVDDGDMHITHVIRGEEHLSNTPRQILIQEALGLTRPVYAHLPLVLATDKSKLSKRKHGETVSLTYYRSRGYLPEALLNFVVFMGWNPGTDQEFFTLDEMIQAFDISKVQKGGAVFNVEKLNWINRHYIRQMTSEEQLAHIAAFAPHGTNLDILAKIQPIIIDRIQTFGDVTHLFESGEVSYFFSLPVYDTTKLLWKTDPKETTQQHLTWIHNTLESLPDTSFTLEGLKEAVWPYAEANGKGSVLWPFRFALSGVEKSPDPFTLAATLGKQETLTRVTNALTRLT